MSTNELLNKAKKGDLEFAELFWNTFMSRYYWQAWNKKKEMNSGFFRITKIYADCIKAAKKNIEKYTNMTLEFAAKKCTEEYECELKYWEKDNCETVLTKKRLRKLLKQLHRWETKDKTTISLKYDLEQEIKDTIAFDVAMDRKPIRLTPAQWRKRGLKESKELVAYWQDLYEDEVKIRCEKYDIIRKIAKEIPIPKKFVKAKRFLYLTEKHDGH